MLLICHIQAVHTSLLAAARETRFFSVAVELGPQGGFAEPAFGADAGPVCDVAHVVLGLADRQVSPIPPLDQLISLLLQKLLPFLADTASLASLDLALELRLESRLRPNWV